MREHELEVAPQRLRVGVSGLAPARAQRVAEPVVDEPELGAQRLPLAVRAPQHDRARQLLRVVGERVLELLGDRDAQRGVAEHLRELVHPRAQQRQRGGAVQRERARQRVRADLGVAVHVAAGPGAVRSTGCTSRTPSSCSISSSTAGIASKSTASKKKRLRRTSSSTFGRTRRSSSVCHQMVRSSRSSAQQLAAAPVARARVVELVEQRRDVPLVVEHGAPRRLGRVRGEHVLDLQLRHQRADVDLAVAQDPRGLGERLALDLAGLVVLAPAPRPLALLGDVRELQLQRARADDRLHRLVRDAAQVGHEPLGGRLVARAHGGGGLEQPLQAGREHASGLLLEHAVERVREERRVLGKPVRRLRRRRTGHIEPRHVPGRLRDHARGDRVVGRLVDEDERAGRVAAGVGVGRDLTAKAKLDVSDVVQP